MNFSKIFSGNTMSVLMGMLTGGKPDMSKLIPIIMDMVTDENVTGLVEEIHKFYGKQSMKLAEGHIIKIVLEPEYGRGLKLVFWDYSPHGQAVKLYNTVYLVDITAEKIKAFIQHIYTKQDEQPQELITISETADQLAIEQKSITENTENHVQ